MLEQVVRRRAQARQALELELQEDCALRIAAARAHVTSRDDAHGPAAALILEAQETFQGLLLRQREIPASHDVEARAHRQCEGHVGLFQLGPPEAISEVCLLYTSDAAD